MRCYKRWRLGSMTWLIVFSVSFAACATPPSEPISVEDSVQCTKNCVAVTKGFVIARFAAEEAVIRLQAELKACRMAHPSSYKMVAQP